MLNPHPRLTSMKCLELDDVKVLPMFLPVNSCWMVSPNNKEEIMSLWEDFSKNVGPLVWAIGPMPQEFYSDRNFNLSVHLIVRACQLQKKRWVTCLLSLLFRSWFSTYAYICISHLYYVFSQSMQSEFRLHLNVIAELTWLLGLYLCIVISVSILKDVDIHSLKWPLN